MTEDNLLQELIDICGVNNVSANPALLKNYSIDESFTEGTLPKAIVYAIKTKQIESILKLANSKGFSVIPISSSSIKRQHGDTLPRKNNTIILNLSRMKKILNIDTKNRSVMVEPGVTFGELIPILRKKGVRLLHPLLPSADKSVMACALEREPTIIPRYHWDSSDPLLCTEVVFGTGDLFRTGTAAGPGSLKEQKKTGQAQINPMGPTQFSPFRIIQGSQGSLGVVCWSTLKLEYLPTIQKIFHYQSNNLQELLELQYELIKYRLCDEILILNNLNLACLLEEMVETIPELAKTYLKWNLIFILAGRGKLGRDKIDYQEEDIADIIKNLNLKNLIKISALNNHELIRVLSNATSSPWKLRLSSACQEIFFLSNFEKIPSHINIVEKEFPQNLGIYIQAINQGTAYHCEFDIFYKPAEKVQLKDKYLKISKDLMDNGAFFNRPYGILADEIYKRQSEQTIIALKKVKNIFDPNHVLNPGVLCFDRD
ncbi:MAG: FAD-binding oxidoreductase [Promethearchaeota archaeon]